MITQTFLGSQPGTRINDYRNSEPRYIKVLGVGEKARAILDQLNQSHSDNVILTGEVSAPEPIPMDEPVNGMKPNGVIVVYQKGERAGFPFLTERTASMLSLIVLEVPGETDADADRKVKQIQKVADLFVTTSDTDFVSELVHNLAS